MLIKEKFKNLVNSFVAKVKVVKFQELVIKYEAEISLKVISPSYSSKPYNRCYMHFDGFIIKCLHY